MEEDIEKDEREMDGQRERERGMENDLKHSFCYFVFFFSPLAAV